MTADLESGFAKSIAELEDTISQVVGTGVVGINIEDSLEEGGPLRRIDEQCARIETIRRTSGQQGLPLVINARVDSFLSNTFTSRSTRIEEAVVRAQAYTESGADCIYPIGPGDRETVGELRDRISSPLNILASSGACSLSELRGIGVNRVSFGPFIFRSCLKRFADIAEELGRLGQYGCFGDDMLSGVDVGAYLIHDPE